MVFQLRDTPNMALSGRRLPATPLPPKKAPFLSHGLLSDENPQSLSPVVISVLSYSEKLLKIKICSVALKLYLSYFPNKNRNVVG